MSKLRRVMCVEDDPDIRMLIEMSLGTVGQLEVLCCDSGSSALANVTAFAPDLVLLDVMIPERSGPETLKALRKMPAMKGVPVVFMTAQVMPAEVEKLLRHRAAGMIFKPFDPMTLARDIQPFWEHGRDFY
jgi:CheY-like chemotaxis protein